MRPSPLQHDIALFAHLGFVILGFGTVLVADYFFALWILGRSTFIEAVGHTTRLHALIWAGLTGLVASGMLLRPDLTLGTTLVKLGLVAVLTVNGVQASALSRHMTAIDGDPPWRLLVRGGITSAVSQVCWWGDLTVRRLRTAAWDGALGFCVWRGQRSARAGWVPVGQRPVSLPLSVTSSRGAGRVRKARRLAVAP